MNLHHLRITAILWAALACASCSVESNWSAPPAENVARIDVASLPPSAASGTAPVTLTAVMTIDGPLAAELAGDMARSKPLRRQNTPRERGPFVVLRSASGDVLALCELLADGAFIPFSFDTRTGGVIPGDRLTTPCVRYRESRNPKAWQAILRLWKLQDEPVPPNTGEPDRTDNTRVGRRWISRVSWRGQAPRVPFPARNGSFIISCFSMALASSSPRLSVSPLKFRVIGEEIEAAP